MKNPLNSILVIILTILIGLGCRMMGIEKVNYLEGKNAQSAAEKVKDKIGKPFKVYQVLIEEKEFRLQAQDPNNPQNLDEYKVSNGFVSGPNPVKLNAMQKDLDKTTFPFDEINFAAIPEFTREAVEKAKIEGAKVNRLEFQRAFALKETGMGSLGNGRWIIQIEGTRESASAVASPDGKLAGVDLSRTTRAASYKVTTPEELKKAGDALKANLGESVTLGEIVIYPDYLSCNVEDSKNPNVSDGYQFGINGLTKSRVERIPRTHLRNFADFSLSEVNLLNATDYIAQAKQRIEMPDAVFTSMLVRRKKDSSERDQFHIIWTANFKQDRNEATVIFNNDGKIIQISKNGQTIFEEKKG